MFTIPGVVHDLDPVHTIRLPDKTDSPLVIDANAVLALAVRIQSFKLVARRDAQTCAFGGGTDLKQLAPGKALEIVETDYRAAVKQRLGIGTRERENHAAS